ncbi:hypothetical protein ONS95_008344 [Cadophora gregata]|uniref:uncharacterized protein n=1 Tax=Cadophora gregata TaxID=51156 RepID=UPI0026DD5546|nr:uncharacterized protein ONS95_008344 [Cadophora gregata]KAK0100389.1 hypothetical protein ONS96_007670 [Cadophora gregata f. sp. sojae]KAK0126763.1 hypothetical protein ONS95_008344 [Cadophora gregata]
MTFLTLGIRHTCCEGFCLLRSPSYEIGFGRTYDDEDFQEFRTEDEHLTQILEDLMVEFQASFDAWGCALPEFLIHSWKPRMYEVLSELDGSFVSEEQRTELQNIGIVLTEESERIPEVVLPEIEVADDYKMENDLEYWLRHMDKIMEE